MYASGDDGKPASLVRVPRRMHWLLWLLRRFGGRSFV